MNPDDDLFRAVRASRPVPDRKRPARTALITLAIVVLTVLAVGWLG